MNFGVGKMSKVKMKTIKNGGLSKAREKAIEILELFEDFLEEKKVVIPNDDKEDYGEKEGLAILFGTDYYYLEDKITEMLEPKKKKVRE